MTLSCGKKGKKTWTVTPLCLMFALWRERNKRILNDVKQSYQAIKSDFMYTFVNWVRVYIEDHTTTSILDFVTWLSLK